MAASRAILWRSAIALSEVRDEEVPASRRVKRGSDVLRPKPISIRFHDRAAVGAADPALDRLPVVAYRVEVDRQRRARVRKMGRGHHGAIGARLRRRP